MIESVVNLSVGAFFNFFYAETVSRTPGGVFWLIAAFFAAGFAAAAVLRLKFVRELDDDEDDDENDENNDDDYDDGVDDNLIGNDDSVSRTRTFSVVSPL